MSMLLERVVKLACQQPYSRIIKCLANAFQIKIPHANIYSGDIHNCQELKTTQIHASRDRQKVNCDITLQGILLSNKKTAQMNLKYILINERYQFQQMPCLWNSIILIICHSKKRKQLYRVIYNINVCQKYGERRKSLEQAK